AAHLPRRTRLPAIMREGLVGFRHAMHVFALLDGSATILGRFKQLRGEALRHALLGTLASRVDGPAHRKSHLAKRTNLDRHLVGCTADTAGFHLYHRAHVIQPLLE